MGGFKRVSPESWRGSSYEQILIVFLYVVTRVRTNILYIGDFNIFDIKKPILTVVIVVNNNKKPYIFVYGLILGIISVMFA